MASAFIEEIDEILNELNEFLRLAIESQLPAVESSGEAEAEGVRISKTFRRSFDNGPIRVRLFPKPISKGLLRFYSIVEEAKMDLGWYNRAIEIYANHKLRLMTPMRLASLLEDNIGKIKSSEKLGRTLIEELKTIRDAEIESPHQHQTPKHRVWTKNRLRARELLSIWVGKAIH